MEGVARRAEELLAEVPEWIWDGATLPVPIEDIADTHFGLLVRDVEDMTEAPGCPSISGDQSISGLLLPSRGEIWVNADEARPVAAAPAVHDRPRARSLGPPSGRADLALLPPRQRRRVIAGRTARPST